MQTTFTKMKTVAAALAALAVLTGCGTKQTETVYIRAECTVPTAPVLDPPTWEQLTMPFDYLPPDQADEWEETLTQLERYEVRLVNYSLELRAGLRAACSTE